MFEKENPQELKEAGNPRKGLKGEMSISSTSFSGGQHARPKEKDQSNSGWQRRIKRDLAR